MKRSNYNKSLIIRNQNPTLALNTFNTRRSIRWFDDQLLFKTIAQDVRFSYLFDISKLTSLRHSVRFKQPPVELHTRKATCVESGRTRGFNRFTGLSRFRLKEFMERGILPGMYRASW